jgi:predicted ribonuclease YlaK
MKILSLLLLTVFLGKSWDKIKQDLESAVIEYTANSRGYQKITIQMVLISKDRSGKAKAVATKIAADDWEESFQENRIDNQTQKKAPTEKRFYDGAAIATLNHHV